MGLRSLMPLNGRQGPYCFPRPMKRGNWTPVPDYEAGLRWPVVVTDAHRDALLAGACWVVKRGLSFLVCKMQGSSMQPFERESYPPPEREQGRVDCKAG